MKSLSVPGANACCLQLHAYAHKGRLAEIAHTCIPTIRPPLFSDGAPQPNVRLCGLAPQLPLLVSGEPVEFATTGAPGPPRAPPRGPPGLLEGVPRLRGVRELKFPGLWHSHGSGPAA